MYISKILEPFIRISYLIVACKNVVSNTKLRVLRADFKFNSIYLIDN